MTAPFAALQAEINQHVIDHLSDVQGTFDGQPFLGLLSASLDDLTFEGPGPAGSTPSLLIAANLLPAKPEGKAVVITSGTAAGTYKVRSINPDGTGLVRIYLTKADPNP